METAKKTPFISKAEYFRMAEESVEKLEYHNGRIVAMSGGTVAHSKLAANMIVALGTRIGEGDCSILTSDARCAIQSENAYVYPDLMVICGGEEYEDDRNDTVINPLVIVEVLSKSTEAYDRGEKFQNYRSIPSFREYILVNQEKPVVEKYFLNEEGIWVFGSNLGLEAHLTLDSLGFSIPLSSIYRNVDFP